MKLPRLRKKTLGIYILIKVSLSKGIPPKPSKPDHVTETKIVYFAIHFKTKDFIL